MIANQHDPDFALLDALFLDGRSVEGLSSQELIPWFNQPHIQTAIAQLKTITDTILAVRHTRARYNAIESLDDLCHSAPNSTDRLRASIALLRPPPPGVEGRGGVGERTKTPTDHALDPKGVQASSRGQSEESPTSAAPGSSSASQISDLRFEIPPPQNPIASAAIQDTPSDSPPAGTQSLLDVLDQLEDQCNDDLDDAEVNADDSDDPDAALDAAEDAAADRHAAAVEAHLGVPITHPEILKAITELRIHDLDAIAARIRAETRASASGAVPDH